LTELAALVGARFGGKFLVSYSGRSVRCPRQKPKWKSRFKTTVRDKISVNLKGRIPELDGIRGIAIGMVLLYHYFIGPIEAPLGSFLSYFQALGRLG
jgi:hypothetical protein